MADTDLRARPSPELTPQLFLLYITTTLQQALLKKAPKITLQSKNGYRHYEPMGCSQSSETQSSHRV